MYIRPSRQRRRSSPIRILILLLLIAASVYVYSLIRQEQIVSPFIPTPLPPTPTRSALSYADEAEGLYLQGKLKEAITAYEQAVTLDPGDVLLYIPLARLLALEGRTVEAVRRANRAVEIAPENARAWAVLGMAHDWNNNLPDAIDACKRAIDLDPTYAEAYAYLAEAYADAGRWGEATEAAQTALKLDNHSVDAHRDYGYVLEKQGDYWDAVDEYEQALKINPNLAYIHVAAGRNYQALGNMEAAESSFQRAIEVDPDNVEAYYRLGRAYYDTGEYERAETYLKQATEADPEFAPAFGYLAFTYWSRRNYEATIDNLNRAIALGCIAARRQAEAFYITVEDLNSETAGPSPGAVMRGDFVTNSDELEAALAPAAGDDDAWADAHGAVALDAHTGQYTVTVTGMPAPPAGWVYVGWFEGVNTLSGDPLSTGPLDWQPDGSLEVELETGWVEGPRIEYFYTLGLAYFYMAECDKSYPLFDAALQIDPEEPNALEGIRLCQDAEQEAASP